MKTKIKDKNKESKWERRLLWSMVIALIIGTVDLIQMSLSLAAMKNIGELEAILNPLFWDLITNIRIQSIFVVVSLGFLLIYYQNKRK